MCAAQCDMQGYGLRVEFGYCRWIGLETFARHGLRSGEGLCLRNVGAKRLAAVAVESQLTLANPAANARSEELTIHHVGMSDRANSVYM